MKIVLLPVAILCVFAAINAEAFVLSTIQYADTISPDNMRYQLAIQCNEAALIHGLYIVITGSNPDATYRIPYNSMYLGFETLRNPTYILEPNVYLDVTQDGTPMLYPPAALPAFYPLIIPVHISGHATHDTTINVHMTYAANSSAQCTIHEGLNGVISVGLVIPGDGPFAVYATEIRAATTLGITDFNAHLKEANHPWSIKLIPAHYDYAVPESGIDAIKSLYLNGTTIILGPITDTAFDSSRNYMAQRGIFGINCCVPDAAHGLFPDYPDQANAFAALLRDSDISGAIILYSGDDTVTATLDSLRSKLQDIEIIPISYSNTNHADVVQRLIHESTRLSDRHGSEHTGVVLLGSGGEYPLLVEASLYDTLYDIHWYVPASSVGLVDILDGKFADGIIGIRADAPIASPLHGTPNIVHETYGIDAKLHHYLAYDSAWVLGNSLLLSQNTNYDRLDTTAKTALSVHAPLSGITYNGTDILGQYGLWGVIADEWMRIGTFNDLTDHISYVSWYHED